MENALPKYDEALDQELDRGEIVAPDHVLLVDDDAGYREMLAWHLSAEGINVRVARDGEEALEMVSDGRVAIVVTDLTMPKLGGLGLLERLKSRLPRTSIIVITGFGTVETSVSAMKNGAEDFLLKPFDVDNFVKRIKRLLNALPDPQSKLRRDHNGEWYE